jgi:hypothetical protein
VDETKGLSSNSDYDSEYATPPPETRSTAVVSSISTSRMGTRSRPVTSIDDGIGQDRMDHDHSPTVNRTLKSPLSYSLREQRTLSNTPELFLEPAPAESSTNPLSIEGLLNMTGAESADTFDQNISGLFESEETSPSLSIYSAKPVWPLTDPAEARLLRHFVQNLAIWVRKGRKPENETGRLTTMSCVLTVIKLDLCDPKNHFQVEVPQRAGSCRILLNAIFALSARHMSCTGKYDPLASNRYHDECLKYLSPMLGDAATVADESLFAATIILRVMEEIDGKFFFFFWKLSWA